MLPTFDIRQLQDELPEAIECLSRTYKDVGAFYLTANELLPSSLREEVFSQARQFFSLPLATKQSINLSKTPNFRGYVGINEEYTEGILDLKESFEFAKEIPAPACANPPRYYRLYGYNQWPPVSILSGFQPVISAYQRRIETIGEILLRSLARTFGLSPPPGSRSGYFPGESCNFSRLIYYEHPTAFAEESVRLTQHTDHVLFTIGIQNAPGLEVQTHDGHWIRVAPRKEDLVIFLGELAEFWTRGYYPACVHRVLNQSLDQERISLTTFFLPDLQYVMQPLDLDHIPQSRGSEISAVRSNSRASDGALNESGSFVVGDKEWERLKSILPGG
ncbi:MAG TPA: 2-oxoglutarate and iron-dependent oxygenase domain-containing protein [Chthoniobacterales bacterium]|nr:2-oxoglutarate and iron-dependent oxygenase domain-containing protein [Chthoniobacterales bacterium]